MIRTGIFGGTFNPVHRGHIALARWLIDNGVVDEVWFTLSPANPLKDDRPGASDDDRKAMLQLACGDDARLRPCFAEFALPRPSYTVTTLQHLAALHPDRKFSLIIGADNWLIFNRWRSPEQIISDFGVIIYPRPGCSVDAANLPAGVKYEANAPLCDVSSTEVRQGMPADSLQDLLTPEVADYISEHHLYGK